MAYIDHNHASMLGTYLHCPICSAPRYAKRGMVFTQNSELRPIWYLGCECAKPVGIL